MPSQSTLGVIYENWKGYHGKLRTAIAPLSDEQLQRRLIPGLRTPGEIAEHVEI